MSSPQSAGREFKQHRTMPGDDARPDPYEMAKRSEAKSLNSRVYAAGLDRLATKTTQVRAAQSASSKNSSSKYNNNWRDRRRLRKKRAGGDLPSAPGASDNVYIPEGWGAMGFGLKPSRPIGQGPKLLGAQQAAGPRNRTLLQVGATHTHNVNNEMVHGDASVVDVPAVRSEESKINSMKSKGRSTFSHDEPMPEERDENVLKYAQEKPESQLHPLLCAPPPGSLFEKLSHDPQWDLSRLENDGFIYLAENPASTLSHSPSSTFDLVVMSHRRIKKLHPRIFHVLSKTGVTTYTYDLPEWREQVQIRMNSKKKKRRSDSLGEDFSIDRADKQRSATLSSHRDSISGIDSDSKDYILPLHQLSAPEVEFVSLEHFERGYTYHKQIFNIPFFRLYRKWKCLRTWRGAVRAKKLKSCRAALQVHLFLLDPVLSKSLLKIRQYVSTVREYKMFWVRQSDGHSAGTGDTPTKRLEPLKLEEFQAKQLKRRNQVRASLHKFQSSVRKVVVETCDQALDSFLVASGFGHMADEMEEIIEDIDIHDQENHSNFGETMIPGARITFTERATMRTQCRRLTRFIRLVDFTIVDTFIEISLLSTVALLKYIDTSAAKEEAALIAAEAAKERASALVKMEVIPSSGKESKQSNTTTNNPKGDSVTNVGTDQVQEFGTNSNLDNGNLEDDEIEFLPLFEIQMRFDIEPRPRLRMEPSRDDFRARLDAIIFDGLKVAMEPERLLTHPMLAPYVRPSEGSADGKKGVNVGDGLDVEAMILQNDDFRIALDEIGHNVDDAFRGARSASSHFHTVKKQFLDNIIALEAMDQHQEQVMARYAEFDDGDFLALLKQYTSQRKAFEQIADFVDVGITRIDLRSFRGILVPSPTRLLASFEALIPAIASKMISGLLNEVNTMNDILSVPPQQVGEFVKVVQTFRKADSGMYELDSRVSEANALVFLMENQNIPLNPELNTNHFLLMQTGNSLKSSITKVEESLEKNKRRFAKQLKTEVPLLRDEIYDSRASLEHTMLSDLQSAPNAVTDYLQSIEDLILGQESQARDYQRYQKALGLEVTAFDELDEVKADLLIKQDLWASLGGWRRLTENWCESPLEHLNSQMMETEISKYFRTASICKRKLVGNPVAEMLKESVSAFKTTLPIVSCLRAPGLKNRHWDQIHALAGFKIEGESLTLKQLMDRGITDKVEQIELISTEAINESVLQGMLAQVAADWKETDFELKPYKDMKNTWIIGAVDQVFELLDNSLVTIGAIMGSRYVGAIRESVESWHRKLLLLQATLDQWLECQKTWMYLEPIFAAPDIARQLPNESKVFKNVTSSWKDIMKQTNLDPNCIKQGAAKGRREAFAKNNAMLDGVQRGLEEYLQLKRGVFPRFYFLSNDELLDILARAQDPRAVQPYLRKCFDNLVRLEFNGSPGSVLDIVAMISGEAERVTLGRNLKARGNVEEWLRTVEHRMRVMMHTIIKSGVLEYHESSRKEWVLTQKAQVVSVVGKIMWCRGSELAMRDGRMKEWYQKNLLQLQELAQLVRTGLQRIERKAIVALVIHDVHARDIIEELVSDNVASLSSFAWKKQLRFYWEQASQNVVTQSPVEEEWQVLVRQSAGAFNYRYEYEGASGCLVITPLTDRCWMTITGALHLRLGANPAGPAGTGKTESSKDLAKALAVQCIVFNCSDQIGYKQMGKLFMGLSAAGAWTCLDEFNRIDIEVLSVVAQQMRLLRRARVSEETEVNFEGTIIPIHEHHVIVTMNPGYAGRTELPDNLKVLFRPVAMMVPDYALIAEIMLLSEGFDTAKELSRKMVRMYKLSSEQLSQQRHYDYGMRAVKSVLVMAGSLKRSNPNLSEDVVLIKACRDSNVPKFLAADLPLFHAIINDLFPGVHVPYSSHAQLQSALVEQLVDNSLQPVPKYMSKVVQIFETQQVRFGIALVGPTGSGKTTGYNMLAAAMNSLYEKGTATDLVDDVVISVLNPKSVTMGELYGDYNVFTQEWHDGLASSIMREYADQDDATRRWTVFDGPVDALWIENMNTVLDDNMTLCLANGERIKLKKEMRCFFEVQDLEVASPATVSRLGVVYMTPEALGWVPYVQSWIQRVYEAKRRNEEMKKNHDDPMSEVEDSSLAAIPVVSHALLDHLFSLFEMLLPASLEFVQKKCSRPVMTTELNLVASCCNLFQACFTEENLGLNPGDMKKKKADELRIELERVCIFAVVWSLGGALADGQRADFSDFFESLLEKSEGMEAEFPGRELIFSYALSGIGNRSTRASDGFLEWQDMVTDFTYNPKMPFFEILVPTVDTVTYSYLVERLLNVGRSTFLTGMTGTGKSSVISRMLTKMGGSFDSSTKTNDAESNTENAAGNTTTNENEQKSADHNNDDSSAEGKGDVLVLQQIFSANTKSIVVQNEIETSLEKKNRGATLRGPNGVPIILFVDDVNMPKVEEYGAQPPIELLRQVVDFAGFYNRSNHMWTTVENITTLLAAAPPGGGRSPLTQRLMRHFNVLSMPQSDNETMKTIFGSILDGFLSIFPTEVRALGRNAISATISVYESIREEMRPTPSRAHYTFNLRDVAKVIQGILQCTTETCDKPQTFVRLWIHEALRVFHDRLVSDEDRKWFTTLTAEKSSRDFYQRWTYEEIFDPEDCRGMRPPILFGGFYRPGERIYSEFTASPKVLLKYLNEFLDDYNTVQKTPMDLVFFSDAIDHLSRVARILNQPRGSALLVGVGGSGRQSLTSLACEILEYSRFSISVTKGYGQVEFREDLKTLMYDAGVKGTSLAFIFSEVHIVHESFLEDINSLLSSGTIPNIWLPEDMIRIVENMRPVLKQLDVVETQENCLSYFQQRLRDNLHLVIMLSPASDSFRTKLRDFPSLLNCTTIDWYSNWPAEALRAVSQRYLGSTKLLENAPDGVASALVDASVMVHASVANTAKQFLSSMRRHVYITPKTFLDSIALYLQLLKERSDQIEGKRNRLQTGIDKLESTNKMVEKMQVQLKDMQPKLAEKAVETQALLEQVAKETKGAEIIANRVSADEAVVKKQQEETAIVQADAQQDLDRALPALEKAIKALNALEKKDITEMRAYKTPPEAVQKVMEAVCVLLGVKPDWNTAKQLMQDSQFMARLVGYDKDNISPKIVKKIKLMVADPIMEVEHVAKVSVAAKSLCMWVHAMEIYDTVAREVQPKRERLAEMNNILADANEKLAVKQAELKAVTDRVDALKQQCDDTVAEKEAVTEEIERTKQRLVRAEKLTVGLADELIRWKLDVEQTGDRAQKLIGDIFLSSAAISYSGAFTGEYRKKLWQQWKEYIDDRDVPGTDYINLIKALTNPVQRRDWEISKLPTDEISTGNAIMVTRGLRWPLMIDPQEQAKTWIKNLESKDLVTSQMSDVNLIRNLETAVRNGSPLLLEDIGESIQLMLDPILLKQSFRQSGRTLIRIGDADIDYDENFRLYMTTKLHNPHYTPEVCIKVTVINFTVTKTGLEDQLLEHVVRKERPDVERRRSALVISMAGDKKQLEEIEKKILHLLSTSTGNILDDEDLVNVLASSKTTSTIINERVSESIKTEADVNELRNGYKPVAIRGALIYFVVANFVAIDPMYQYSLEYFIRLFIFCIENATPDPSNLSNRLENLKEFITSHMYKQVCRGLFQRHTLTFSFLMTCSILRTSGKVSEVEFSTMIRGAVDVSEPIPQIPSGVLLTSHQWSTLMTLETKMPGSFAGLRRSLLGEHAKLHVEEPESEKGEGMAPALQSTMPIDWGKWQTWASRPDCITTPMPDGWSDKLTTFQKAIIIKIFREDLALSVVSNVIMHELGESFTIAPMVSMADVFADTDALTPCVFILSPGADPTSILLQFAESKHYAKRLKIISLGQGQGARAEALISKSVVSGDWVLLQNCHLAKSWMESLERIVFEISEAKIDVDRDFRLFLTSFPADYFPVSVLQTSIKMTNEPPRGIRANMLRSFELAMPKENFKGRPRSALDRARRRILFSLAFFHAIAQERRKFGPLGWNIRYEFNDSDIVTSISTLEMFLDGLPKNADVEQRIPWDALLYVTGEINYGGRVTDDWDRRCLNTILERSYRAPILEDGDFRLSKSGEYFIPESCSIESIMTTLQKLPSSDQPEVFGLHENAGVAAQEAATAAMFDCILTMQPKSSGGGESKGGEIVKSDDEIVSHLSQQIESQVPEILDRSRAGSQTFRIMPESGLMDSLGVVLSQGKLHDRSC